MSKWDVVDATHGKTYIYNVKQGSEDWHNIRKNRITASNAAIATGRSSKFKSVQQLASEIRGETLPEPINSAMLHGIEGEPYVRKWYEKYKNVTVDEIGFAYPESNHRLGVSVDGLVGNKGIIEIKCPVEMYKPLKWHIKKGALATPSNKQPKHIWESHYIQMQMGMHIMGREWCDYIVAHFPPEGTNRYECGTIYMERIFYNKSYWNEIEHELNIFITTYLSDLPIPIIYT